MEQMKKRRSDYKKEYEKNKLQLENVINDTLKIISSN